jgi:hypothetical protein
MTDADNMRFAIATQIFIKLRRHTGRVIDVTWALQEPRYAEEVLRLARVLHDAELEQLADRFEGLKAGKAPPPPAPPARQEPITEDSVDQHYIGHLR